MYHIWDGILVARYRHKNKMHLLLATLTLTRYHLIWFTTDATSQTTTHVSSTDPLSGSVSLASASHTHSITPYPYTNTACDRVAATNTIPHVDQSLHEASPFT